MKTKLILFVSILFFLFPVSAIAEGSGRDTETPKTQQQS